MIEDTPSRRCVVAPPVLILEDDMIRAGEMLAEVEDLGLRGLILARRAPIDGMPLSDPFSLAVLSVASLEPRELRIPEALRRHQPDLPMLMICEAKDFGMAPWPKCTVMPKKGALKQLRGRVADVLGIVLSDEPGTTLKSS